jgi:hypothetical protein
VGIEYKPPGIKVCHPDAQRGICFLRSVSQERSTITVRRFATLSRAPGIIGTIVEDATCSGRRRRASNERRTQASGEMGHLRNERGVFGLDFETRKRCWHKRTKTGRPAAAATGAITSDLIDSN